MYTSVLAIIVLIALPIFFPEAALYHLQAILTWFEKRRMHQDQEIERLEVVVATHREWADWVENVRRRLTQSSARKGVSPPRSDTCTLLLAQALAAGERYLQNSDRHSFPNLYAKTEQLCRRLRQHLKIQRSTQKKGQTGTA